MSEKNLEAMKKILEKKKEKQALSLQQSVRPQKKMGGSQSAFKSTKTGGAKKV